MVLSSAEEIIKRNKRELGKKEIYFATEGEISVLIAAGADITFINRDNHDGTFSHQVVFKKMKFLASSMHLLAIT